MVLHVSGFREGFDYGFTPITDFEDDEDAAISLAVLKLETDEMFSGTTESETIWLLLQGDVTVNVANEVHEFHRKSVFKGMPAAIHLPTEHMLAITANSDAEILVASTNNVEEFETCIYTPEDIGKDRVIVDTPPENAELTFGETIIKPGKWNDDATKPLANPTVYHYRFENPEEGFGLSQFSDEGAAQIRHGDTSKVQADVEFSQVAAPGQKLYTAWVTHKPSATIHTIDQDNNEE